MPQQNRDIRNTQIQVRLSPQEKALIEKYAKKNRLTISDYVREKILNPERQPINEANT